MPSNTNYAIFWDPSGGAAFPAGYQAGLESWFADLAHDSGGLLNTDSVLTQYGDEFGHTASYNSHFGGAYVDTDPYPANGCSAAPRCLDSAQIRAELVSFVQAHALPSDLEHMYFLLTPSGVESCTDEAEKVCSAGTGTQHRVYCSYHEFIELAKGVLVYAYTPYMAGLKCGDEQNTPNGNPSDEELSGGLVHEHSEAVTDPELNAWYDEQGKEVGDKCRVANPNEEFGPPLGEAPNGSSYNQVLNGDRYWYQQEWSNEAGGCAQRKATIPTIKKMKPKSGPGNRRHRGDDHGYRVRRSGQRPLRRDAGGTGHRRIGDHDRRRLTRPRRREGLCDRHRRRRYERGRKQARPNSSTRRSGRRKLAEARRVEPRTAAHSPDGAPQRSALRSRPGQRSAGAVSSAARLSSSSSLRRRFSSSLRLRRSTRSARSSGVSGKLEWPSGRVSSRVSPSCVRGVPPVPVRSAASGSRFSEAWELPARAGVLRPHVRWIRAAAATVRGRR